MSFYAKNYFSKKLSKSQKVVKELAKSWQKVGKKLSLFVPILFQSSPGVGWWGEGQKVIPKPSADYFDKSLTKQHSRKNALRHVMCLKQLEMDGLINSKAFLINWNTISCENPPFNTTFPKNY
jgi:hypothetical protein